MNLNIIYNPFSGKKNSSGVSYNQAFSEKLFRHLKLKGGINTKISGEIVSDKDSYLKDCDLLLILGGDGTVLEWSSCALKNDIPIMFLPGGNQNLLIKYACSEKKISSIYRLVNLVEDSSALEDLVEKILNYQRYLIEIPLTRVEIDNKKIVHALHMLSFGFDANVVRILSQNRSNLKSSGYGLKQVSNLTYLKYIFQAFFDKRSISKFKLTVDNKIIAEDESGYLYLSNLNSYALGLTPMGRNYKEERKDYVSGFFIRKKNVLVVGKELLFHFLQIMAPLEFMNRFKIFFVGQKVQVTLKDSFFQIDGDLCNGTELLVTREDKCLKLLRIDE